MSSPMQTHCPVCGQPDNCGDCTHEEVPQEMYVTPREPTEEEYEVLSFLGTCQSCGRYLDVRQHKRCPSPCDGYIG